MVADDGADRAHAVGVRRQKQQVEQRHAEQHTGQIADHMANRLMAGFRLDEIQALFEAVARSAVSAEENRLCKVLADKKVREE